MAKKKPTDKVNMEKNFAALFNHIQNQNFESIEELQEFLKSTIGKKIDEIVPKKKGKLSNKDSAKELIWEAYTSPPKKGKALVKKALELDPDNADAYVYLAENASDIDQAIEYYSKGVEAGERAIGKTAFEEFKGNFWGFHETRPFMKAKEGLASCLYINNKTEEAIKHYQEMLALNPGDNQGIRYKLAICLVDQNNAKAYLDLYKEFEGDAGAVWQYTYALYLFKQSGNSPKANRALKNAYNDNPFVLQFLTGKKKPPKYLPEYMGFGDENEAIYCVNDSIKIWIETPEALQWVNEFYKKQKKLN